MTYDYLIVGAGFFGSTFARLATDSGKSCLVIDVRNHVGGNAYSKKMEGIDVHVYGPHIFHTNSRMIWDFVNKFSEFNSFQNNPKSYVNGKLYSLPFNMNTFYELWGCITPEQAKEIIESQRLKLDREPDNLEEQALSLIGHDVYHLLIKEYTKKQWQKDPKDLPASIIKRLPIRYTYDNNYYNDRYQGIPLNGYTKLFENLLGGIHVELNCDFMKDRSYWEKRANKIVFTGKIDQYFDFAYGDLEYRTLEFNHEVLDTENFQGIPVINYPEEKYPWTRKIEHKHFVGTRSSKTVVTTEIPAKWDREKVPYYPINDDKNNQIFKKYRDLSKQESNVIFGGRLSEYIYYDMHQVIASAMSTYNKVSE